MPSNVSLCYTPELHFVHSTNSGYVLRLNVPYNDSVAAKMFSDFHRKTDVYRMLLKACFVGGYWYFGMFELSREY